MGLLNSGIFIYINRIKMSYFLVVVTTFGEKMNELQTPTVAKINENAEGLNVVRTNLSKYILHDK